MPNGLAGSAQVSYPLAAPSGTAGAPSFSFAASPTSGMYLASAGVVGFSGAATFGAAVTVTGVLTVGATKTLTKVGEDLVLSDSVDLYARFAAYGLHDTNAACAIGDSNGGLSGAVLGPDSVLSWRSASALAGTTVLSLYLDAADILAQRRGVNAQSFRVYETYTDAGNYRMLNIGGNGLTLQSAGTGVSAGSLYLWNSQAGALEFATTNTRRWVIEATGSFVPYADNTYDIGSATNQARDIYAARYVFSGYFVAPGAGAYLFNGRGGLRSSADGVLRLSNDADSSFTRLCFGGTTAAFPAIKRDGANLALVPADGSAGYIDLTVHDVIGNSVYLSNLVGVGANNTNIGLSLTGFAMNIHNSAASLTLAVTGGATLATFAGTGYLEMYEVTAPSAPAANTGRIYFEDNGAGKTRLMCLFASGSAQQLAIEP